MHTLLLYIFRLSAHQFNIIHLQKAKTKRINLMIVWWGDSMWSFLAEGKEVKHPIVRDLRMFLQVGFESVQSLLFIGGRIHPDFNLVEALPDLDSDAVHDIDEFVLGTDGWEESALPQLVAFPFLNLYLKASAARVVDILPHRLHSLLKQIHIAVYIPHALLVSSLVGFRNWKISQNSFT